MSGEGEGPSWVGGARRDVPVERNIIQDAVVSTPRTTTNPGLRAR